MPDNDNHLTPDNLASIVMLVFGPMENGAPFWCYVGVVPGHYEQVKMLVSQKRLNLTTFEDDGYGDIIVSGEGALPPNDVTKKVAQMFNVPIRQLFADIDPNSEIAKKIEALKKELEG